MVEQDRRDEREEDTMDNINSTLEDILEKRVIETINVLYELGDKLYGHKSILSQLLQNFKMHVSIENHFIKKELYDLVDEVLNYVANLAYKSRLDTNGNTVNDVFYRLFLIKQILQRCSIMEVE